MDTTCAYSARNPKDQQSIKGQLQENIGEYERNPLAQLPKVRERVSMREIHRTTSIKKQR